MGEVRNRRRLWGVVLQRRAIESTTKARCLNHEKSGHALIWCRVEPVARDRRTAPTLQQSY
jgi:hypothetical protein